MLSRCSPPPSVKDVALSPELSFSNMAAGARGPSDRWCTHRARAEGAIISLQSLAAAAAPRALTRTDLEMSVPSPRAWKRRGKCFVSSKESEQKGQNV